jgi:hypothetical protein
MTQQELTAAFADLWANYAQIKKAYTLDKSITATIEENFLAWGAQVAKKVALAADEITGWNNILNTTQAMINSAIASGKEPGAKSKMPWGLLAAGAGILTLVFWRQISARFASFRNGY